MQKKWSLMTEDNKFTGATIEYDYDTNLWKTVIEGEPILPPILHICFFEKNENPIGDEHTRMFISERIPPKDRQDMVSIMKKAGMFCYDEAKLIDLYHGKSSQDKYWMKKEVYAQ